MPYSTARISMLHFAYMFTIWPYLLRFAVALYFIYPHVTALLNTAKKMQLAVFSCINEYIPATIAFTLWHALYIILGILILIWPRPVLPLIVALIIIASQLYINFSLHNYTATNMFLFILMLVTLALIIYHASRPQFL